MTDPDGVASFDLPYAQQRAGAPLGGPGGRSSVAQRAAERCTSSSRQKPRRASSTKRAAKYAWNGSSGSGAERRRIWDPLPVALPFRVIVPYQQRILLVTASWTNGFANEHDPHPLAPAVLVV